MRGRTIKVYRELCCVNILFFVGLISAFSQRTKPTDRDPKPESAIPAILAAFDKYEVVGMPEAHGLKDVDDLILALIRTPAFPDKVNDIEVECGNSLYQPTLDRYIAGEDVPFADVQKVWRNTTQPMCSESGFFEEFFPLVRMINQKLPAAKRIRVLAGDPPINWDLIKIRQDFSKFIDRDASIASVMEQEVLAKHRKALMLFGTFHLLHDDRSAVSIYEKVYPNVTFVISHFGIFNTQSSPLPTMWPAPSLVRTKGTWLGALGLDRFFPAPYTFDKDCNLHNDLPKGQQKPTEALIDAFLYLGPQDLQLSEPTPADIALDVEYAKELHRRELLVGFPGATTSWTLDKRNQEIIKEAETPVYVTPTIDAKLMSGIRQLCLDAKQRDDTAK